MEFRNLLPANVADGTDTLGTTSGFSIIGTGTVLTSDTTYFSRGSRSLKTVTPNNLGSGSGGFITDKVNVNPLTTYVISLKIKNSNLVRLKLKEYNSSNAEIGGVNSSAIAISDNFTTRTLVYTTSATGTKLAIRVDGEYANTSVTIYVDELQLETGSTPTNWMPGNILTFNQQSVETDLTGLSRYPYDSTTSHVRDTTEKYSGNASMKGTILTGGTSINLMTSGQTYSPGSPAIKANTYFLISIRFKAPIGKTVSSYGFWFSSAGFGSASLFPGKSKVATGGWDTITYIAKSLSNTVTTYFQLGMTGVPGDYLYWDEAWLIDYTPFILGGIGSQEAVSNASLKSNILPGSVPSGQVINNVSLRSSLNPNGVLSSEHISNLVLQSKLNLSSVLSSEFVNNLLLRSNINPNSIPSVESVSDLVLNNILVPLGIVSEEKINNLTLTNALELIGIISEEQLGNPLLLQNIILEAIETQETINDIILYFYYEFMQLLLIEAKYPKASITAQAPHASITHKYPHCEIKARLL